EPVVIAVMVEEESVHEYGSTKPVRTPSPAAPAEAAVEATDIDSRSPSKSEAHRIVERRIVTERGRSPNVLRIVRGYIDHLRIGRLNRNGGLVALLLGGYRFLRVRIQFAVRASFGAQLLDSGHYVGLLR